MATIKKAVKKSAVKKQNVEVASPVVSKSKGQTFKEHAPNHVHFLAALLLFSGFSVYSFSSFFTANDRYLDTFQASVLGSGQEVDMNVKESTIDHEIFTDVFSDHQNALAIGKLRDNGVIGGYEDGSFKPDALINRAELLTLLSHAIDADLTGATYANCFGDVADQWFAPFACYAKAKAWVAGYADNTYRPAQSVTKAEALKITMTALGYEVEESDEYELPFADVKAGDWFAPYVDLALEEGIVGSADLFNPTQEMSRAQVAQMIYNAMFFKDLI